MDNSKPNIIIYRIVAGSWLFGWFLKVVFYAPYLGRVAFEHPFVHGLFPAFFLENTVSLVFYYLPALAVFSFFTGNRLVLRAGALLMLASSVVLNLHINTYNDATFVTSFWVALWLVWFVFSFYRAKAAFNAHAVLLGHMLVGVIFLGGFIGKLTPEYYSGEVIRMIFIEQSQQSHLAAILGPLSAAGQNACLALVSKLIIITEGILAMNIFVYHRFLAYLSLAMIPVLALFSTWRIFSVSACLMGLLTAIIVIEHFMREKQNNSETSRVSL